MVKQNEYYNIVNMVLNVLRNHKAYQGRGGGGGEGRREIIITPIATLPPPE